MELPRQLNNPFILGGVSLLSVLAIGSSVYFYQQYRSVQHRLQNPTEAAKIESQQLVSSISKLMMLPTDEEPTIASVADRDKLANQPFFANAANGDKVLIYLKSKKAVLYRPSLNKIIEVAPVNMNATGSAAPSPAVRGDMTEKITIALRNGTPTVGLTRKFETVVTSKIPDSFIADIDTAVKTDYTQTFIYDLTGAKADGAAYIANALGIEVGQLSPDEPVASLSGKANFLIIVGADKK